MTVVDLYTIQIIREGLPIVPHPVIGNTSATVETMMAETEENLTDLLPPGYRARIRRWDHPDPDEGIEDADADV